MAHESKRDDSTEVLTYTSHSRAANLHRMDCSRSGCESHFRVLARTPEGLGRGKERILPRDASRSGHQGALSDRELHVSAGHLSIRSAEPFERTRTACCPNSDPDTWLCNCFGRKHRGHQTGWMAPPFMLLARDSNPAIQTHKRTPP